MFEINHFNYDNFVAALATKLFPKEAVRCDNHANYLFRYLSSPDLAAVMLIIEPAYVDADYLADYSSYYSTCFTHYEKTCKRIHFFSITLSRADFERHIKGEVTEEESRALKKAYVGFIVIRPLPDAIIGRTQLMTYGPDAARRHYCAVVDYKVNLFGLRLKVRSLGFQEQDRALAACATVALWSCFHKTSDLFGTPAPRPPEITESATRAFFDKRSLPSTGLYAEQVCCAIRDVGLEPEVIGAAGLSNAPLISLIYGHLRMGLPVLLVVKIEGGGLHALVISGYSIQDHQVIPHEVLGLGQDTGPPMIGRRIDEFYAHDDQHGPFSQLRILGAPQAPCTPPAFSGSWKTETVPPCALRLEPYQVIVPVYRKIRLSYIQALQWLERVRPTAERIAASLGIAAFEWDLFLTTTNEYKGELASDMRLSSPRRTQLLTGPQPRFMWRCMFGDTCGPALFEMLIDATGFVKSFPIETVNFYNEEFAHRFKETISASTHRLVTRELKARIADEYDLRNGPPAKASTPIA